MKIFILFTIYCLILGNLVFSRSTGCTEGNCENGSGTWTYTDLPTYVGEWRDGNMNGQGKFTLADGTVKKGFWKDGELVEPN